MRNILMLQQTKVDVFFEELIKVELVTPECEATFRGKIESKEIVSKYQLVDLIARYYYYDEH